MILKPWVWSNAITQGWPWLHNPSGSLDVFGEVRIPKHTPPNSNGWNLKMMVKLQVGNLRDWDSRDWTFSGEPCWISLVYRCIVVVFCGAPFGGFVFEHLHSSCVDMKRHCRWSTKVQFVQNNIAWMNYNVESTIDATSRFFYCWWKSSPAPDVSKVQDFFPPNRKTPGPAANVSMANFWLCSKRQEWKYVVASKQQVWALKGIFCCGFRVWRMSSHHHWEMKKGKLCFSHLGMRYQASARPWDGSVSGEIKSIWIYFISIVCLHAFYTEFSRGIRMAGWTWPLMFRIQWR